MIFKRIKDSKHIWNPETSLVFNKNRKVIGRYVNNQIIVDEEVLVLCNKFKAQIDPELQGRFLDESYETEDLSQYENHPAFKDIVKDQKSQDRAEFSTDFVELFTNELKLKLSDKINELVYRIVDLESSLKNLNEDYERVLVENESLKRVLNKL